MSDNDRKDPCEIKQGHEYHDPLERLEQGLNSNEKSDKQNTQSSLQPDQSISQSPPTPFHGDDFDLSFLEAELENNLTSNFPFGKQEKQEDLHKTSNESTFVDVEKSVHFNHSEQKKILSENIYSSPICHDEEQILDALSPLPIQKNQSSQKKTTPINADPFFKKDDLSEQSQNAFSEESNRGNNSTITPTSCEQVNRFSQTTSQYSNVQQNYDDNQSSYNTFTSNPYEYPTDQEYHTTISNSSTNANTSPSSSLDSTQTNKQSDLKDFPQKGYTTNYPQLYEDKFSEQEFDAVKIPEYNDTHDQYINVNNAGNISDQNNEKKVLYNQNPLTKVHPSSENLSSMRADNFFAQNYAHRDTPAPNVDTYKFAEGIVEKTGPIMVPEVPYEAPEYDVPTDDLKKEFADVFNVGNVPEEDFSRQQQNEAFNEIFHKTIQNLGEDTYIKKQNTNDFPTDNTEYYSSFSKNSAYKDINEVPSHTSLTSAFKSLIISKISTRSIVLLTLIVLGYVGYFHFFVPSQTNENIPIIYADNVPFKIKQESTKTESDIAHNLDVYKQTTGQNEKPESTQQFLIDNSEAAEDLISLNQQESTSNSSSSFDGSDVDDAVTEAINHTIPAREVQTVIVKPDGTITLSPAHYTDKKPADKTEETIDQASVEQPQDTSQASSHFSDTKSQDTEHNLKSDIDQIIAENTFPSRAKEKNKNTFIPIPSHAKINSATQTHIASNLPLPNRETIQNSENYYVQLASQPTHALAKDSLKRAKSKFGYLIGTHPLNIQSALIPGKGTYYRVRVQTRNRNEAINLCEDIKNSGGNCFITR
ncbi:SPOR domain-containing protein [Bartonella doshiae]|nr:SPOR domain-containing protein [Bartonella doshiae]MBB6159472.1 hypothetical protein [Bartonella doshiae]